MAEDCVQFVSMAGSSDNEEKYGIYEAGSEMFCVVGIDNKQGISPRTSGTKPRYKQSYREAWESMRDFKGWLTSVPGNTSKAYCKLCQKELHCHRLSLLKHKVTFKHQTKEEEHNLINPRGEKNLNESQAKKLKGEKCVSLESNDADAAELEATEATNADGGLILSEATTSENCDELSQEDEAMPAEAGPISTQVTDLRKGKPGTSIHVVLYKLIDGRWTLIHEGLTNEEGQYNQFFTNSNNFSPGRYKLHFDVDKYFENVQESTIFPFIEIAFDAKDVSSHYHIPLLLSPFGYSTYKGS